MRTHAPENHRVSPHGERGSTLKRYLPVVVWSATIFLFSSIPSAPAPETWWNFLLKKTAHVIEYAILYWLTWRAMNHEPRTTNQYVGPLLFTIFYAVTDEIHQSFVHGRHARWYDIGFDTFGAFIALWMIRRTKRPLKTVHGFLR